MGRRAGGLGTDDQEYVRIDRFGGTRPHVTRRWRQQPVFWVRIQQTQMMGILFWLFYQRLKNGASGT